MPQPKVIPEMMQILEYLEQVCPLDNSVPIYPQWYRQDLSDILELAGLDTLMGEETPQYLVDSGKLLEKARYGAEYLKANPHPVSNHLCDIDLLDASLPARLDDYLSRVAKHY